MAVCVGCGLRVDANGVLNVRIDPNSCLYCDNTNGIGLTVAGGGGITCTGSGIAINASTGDTSSIDMFGNGTVGSPIQGNVRISGTNCNSISILGDGLFVPCADSSIGLFSSSTGPFVQAVVGVNNTYDFPATTTATITNISCFTQVGFVEVKMGGIEVIQAPGGSFGQGSLMVNIDGGGFISAQPSTSHFVHNPLPTLIDGVAAANMLGDCNNLEEQNLLVLGPGASATYQAQFRWFQNAGSGTVQGNASFETYWHMSNVSACDHI